MTWVQLVDRGGSNIRDPNFVLRNFVLRLLLPLGAPEDLLENFANHRLKS